MARKSKNSASAPDLLGGAPVIPRNPKPTAEGAENAPAGFVVFNAAEGKPVLPQPDPNALMFEEYGIAGDTTNIPQILKAILCELVRRRVSR